MIESLNQLRKRLRELTPGAGLVVAWSGGVDSTLVAAVALQVRGESVRVMTVDSEFLAASERKRILALAETLGFPLQWVPVTMLDDANVRHNGSDRCYRCKKRMLSAILEAAIIEDNPGPVTLLDGTNAGDDPQRPGLRALQEAGVVSPLLDCGLDKKQVRILAHHLGLPNADQPSNSCLATRIRSTGLDQTGLDRVEQMERALVEMGFAGVRARLDDLTVIVEIPNNYTRLLESSHDRIKDMIEKMGLTLAGYGLRDHTE